MPAAWVLDPATSLQQVRVVWPSLSDRRAQIVFAFVPGLVDTSKPLGTTTIAGERAVIVADGAVSDLGTVMGYGRDAVLQHRGQTYQLDCTAFAGAPVQQLLSTCTTFAASLQFAG